MSANIGKDGYQELNQTNLQNAIDTQFGRGKATVMDNGDGTFTVSFVDSKKDYNITSNGVESGINWNIAMKEATSPSSQDEERNNNVIGIGTDGKPVDMDLWEYTLLDNNTSYALNKSTAISTSENYTVSSGYKGIYSDGEIEGYIPQYISTNNGKDFYPVVSLENTFRNCENLQKCPAIPTTITSLRNTFNNCINLTNISSLPNCITNMQGAFYHCSLIEKLDFLPNSLITMYGAFQGCTNLKKICYIPDSVTNMTTAFYGCSNLEEIINIPTNLIEMKLAFYKCTNIGEINISISSNVVNMTQSFKDCHKLSGNIIVQCNPTEYNECFYGCSTDLESELQLSGQNDVISNLLNTKSNNSHISME